jgi:hypothetical protein
MAAPVTTQDRNSISFPELLAWAWRETPPAHQDRKNLLLHLFAVPLFVTGHALIAAGIVTNPWLLLAGPVCIAVSLRIQKYGHSLERNPSIPFAGPRDFVRRIYGEQFCNFWRFLLSGGWSAAFKAGVRGD